MEQKDSIYNTELGLLDPCLTPDHEIHVIVQLGPCVCLQKQHCKDMWLQILFT